MNPSQQHTEQLLSHVKALRSLARVLVEQHAAADDLVQDTLVLALEGARGSEESLGGWLRGVMRHKAGHQRRERAARSLREQGAARREALPSTLDLVSRKAQLAILVEEVLRLKEPYQTVLYLRYFEDKSAACIARELGLAQGTVASQVHRGLALLRERLDQRAGGDRPSWVGALAACFTADGVSMGSVSGGVWMATAVKLVGTAALLGALLLVAWERDRPASTEVALMPSGGALEGRTGQRVALETTTFVPPVPQPLEASVPDVELAAMVDPSIAAPRERAPAMRPESPPSAEPVAVQVAARALPFEWPTAVARQHKFCLLFIDATFDGDSSGVLPPTSLCLDLEQVYCQEINALDTFDGLVLGAWPSFERVFRPKWGVEFGNSSNEAGSPDSILTATSPLSERVLRFVRAPQAEGYLAEVEDLVFPGLWEPVDNLVADMDLRSLGPPPDAAVGQSWQVSLSVLERLLVPGGNLQARLGPDAAALGLFPEFHVDPFGLYDGVLLADLALPEAEGTCTVTSTAREQTSDGSFLHFQFSLESRSTLDLLKRLRGLGQADGAEALEVFEHADHSLPLDLVVTLEGTGLWDERWQRVSQLDLEGELSTVLKLGQDSLSVMVMETTSQLTIAILNQPK